MKHFFLINCLAMVVTLCSFGQTKKRAAEIIGCTGDYYINNDYELKLSYVLRTNEGEVVDQYEGLSVKKGSQSYTRIGPVEYIQDMGDFLLKINNDEKAMIFSKGEEGITIPTGLFTEFVDKFNDVAVDEGPEFFRIKMTSGKVSQNQYQSVEIFISKKDFSFLKQHIVFVNGGGNVLEGKELHLEVTFKRADNLLKQEDVNKLDLETYLGGINNAGPIGKYKDYEYIDATKV